MAHPGRSTTCPTSRVDNCDRAEGFHPYERDPKTLARPWAVPGTPGLEHRIGGLEKADITGNVSYDPDNHHRMQLLRQAKVARIADDIPPTRGLRAGAGDLLILGWGSTYGAIRSAVERLQARAATRRPRPPAPPEPVPGATPRRSSGAIAGS